MARPSGRRSGTSRPTAGPHTPWHAPALALGIPDSWVSPWCGTYYNGRSRNIHGNRSGTEYQEGHFKGVAIDPSDPPRDESQASSLQRLSLFERGETWP